MHLFNTATIFIILSLIGVEFSVTAFINPAARRLDPEPQLKILSRLASVFGRVMPVWYPVCALLLGVETWLYWQAPERDLLLAALAIWLLASVASIVFLVPMEHSHSGRCCRLAADYIASGTGDIVCALQLSLSQPSSSHTLSRAEWSLD